ncbi:MAG: LysM peptidoglycan-binding domain-containing protein [Planctomycetaceae bacterium]
MPDGGPNQAMHPDRKIGIAMGILLIGVVAALFFRNEPLYVEEGLSARRESELNRQLKERDVSVYLTSDSAPADADDDREPEWTLSDVLEQTRRNDAVPAPIGLPVPTVVQRNPESPLKFAPPEPLPEVTETAPTDAATPSEDAVPLPPAANQLGAPKESQSAEYIEYTVKFGDTLSGIAERFLGAQSRYREIYEINKDRMPNPDALKVGKALRIPRS